MSDRSWTDRWNSWNDRSGSWNDRSDRWDADDRSGSWNDRSGGWNDRNCDRESRSGGWWDKRGDGEHSSRSNTNQDCNGSSNGWQQAGGASWRDEWSRESQKTEEAAVAVRKQGETSVEKKKKKTGRVFQPPGLMPPISEAGDAEDDYAIIATTDMPCYDLSYFQNWSCFQTGCWQHNAALKYFREQLESDGEESKHFDGIINSEAKAYEVGKIVKKKGMNWHFEPDQFVKWYWQEMVAQLDAASMEEVVNNGPDGRSGGLIGCAFMARPNSYDHKRHHQLKTDGKPVTDRKLRIWDFVLFRKDGSCMRLHPNWSNTKIETHVLDGYAEEVPVPTDGPGTSMGHGTYKYHKDVGNLKTLRFDAAKRPKK